MSGHQYFALWLNFYRVRQWAGPFDTNVAARESVPENAMSSVITSAIPMTSGERLEGMRITNLTDHVT